MMQGRELTITGERQSDWAHVLPTWYIRRRAPAARQTRKSAQENAELTHGGGVVVELLRVLHEEVDEQEDEQEGRRHQVERRHHAANGNGRAEACS
jgi:hypothetical protein